MDLSERELSRARGSVIRARRPGSALSSAPVDLQLPETVSGLDTVL